LSSAETNFVDVAESQKLQQERILSIDEKIQQNKDQIGDPDNLDDSPESEEILNILIEGLDILQVQRSIVGCSRCPLRQSAVLPVPFSGGKKSMGRNFSVIGIGEAPGEDEDLENTPFVGRNGKLLRKACDKVGLKIDALANTCCCRPPGNRTPTAGEIKACRPNLVEQIGHLDPWLIICFGATPLKVMRSDFRITIDHGVLFPVKWPELEDRMIWTVGVYHPSYVLRQRKDEAGDKIRKDFVEDLLNLAGVVEARRVLGAEPIHPLMERVRRLAPYIPGNPTKTEELKKTYLQKLDEAEDGGSYGIPKAPEKAPRPSAETEDDLPF